MSLRDAIAAAVETAAEADGTLVKLRRGSTITTPVPTLKGQHVYQTVDPQDGHVVTVAGQDFLVLPEHYDFGNGPVEPEVGDLVLDPQADGDHVYALLDIPGEPSWRWADAWRVRFRLHTKEVATP